jgi:hypothetical protein
MAPDDDPKVRDLLSGKSVDDVIDAATRAELERWFSLPSFDQVAEQEPAPVVDEEMLEAQKRRDAAIALVDPAFLASLHHRNIENPESLIKFAAVIDVRVNPDIALFDSALAERAGAIADPRVRERPEDLEDDLKDCTPQALLRDLHRSEEEFEKTFEVVDMSAEQKLDPVAEVESAMTTNWRLPELPTPPYREACALIDLTRADRRRPWPELFKTMTLANRRITE